MTLNRERTEMAKTCAEKLGEWVKERISTARDRNAVALLCAMVSTRRWGGGFPNVAASSAMLSGEEPGLSWVRGWSGSSSLKSIATIRGALPAGIERGGGVSFRVFAVSESHHPPLDRSARAGTSGRSPFGSYAGRRRQ